MWLPTHRLHKQCEVLVAALANGEVCTRENLLDAWAKDSRCKSMDNILQFVGLFDDN